jgi:GNAT superfamily N-acetyltransferase
MSPRTPDLLITQITPDDLTPYASIPTAFEVTSILHVEPADRGLGGIRLIEHPVSDPYVKDYDAQEDGGPEHWSDLHALSKWAIFLGLADDRPIGGATVALDTPDISGFHNSVDIAGLWDFRVHPDFRRQGVGTALLNRVVEAARSHGCPRLKIETQSINVPACRFYAARGCILGGLDVHAYGSDPACAHETMLLWYLDLQA